MSLKKSPLKRGTSRLKRSPLRKHGKSETAKCKQRIQKLLTQIVRLRDKTCIFAKYPETGQCSGVTAADHIISRARSISYGELWNVICVCQRHHIWWKPQNPLEYTRIVKEVVGDNWNKIERTLKDQKAHRMDIYDWTKVELYLKAELKKYA